MINKILDGNPVELRLIYSSCDLILAPSILEAFGQVALEGASCGVPTLGFNDTGLTDIIDHKLTGYLANYLNQEDFENGINWVMEKLSENQNYFYKNCLSKVKDNFNDKIIASKYLDIYKSLIST